ncbi:MAG TPA: hypothetical protein PLC42_03500 [Parachlamydiaceae bacterium]|nr:hypothetical protein [Parachlamydiaceae bacterium]
MTIFSCYESFKNYGWVFSGVAVGATFGSLSTCLKTGSFFIRDFYQQFNFIQKDPLLFRVRYQNPIIEKSVKIIISKTSKINQLREKEFQFFRNRYIDLISIFHLIPPVVLVIQNYVRCIKEDVEKPDNKKVKKLAKKVFKTIIFPFFKTVVLLVLALFIRLRTDRYFRDRRIEPSGHMMAQCINAFASFYYLKAINDEGTPLEKKNFSIYFAVVSMTDAIWTLPTAAKYHSAADIITGAGYVGIAATISSLCL